MGWRALDTCPRDESTLQHSVDRIRCQSHEGPIVTQIPPREALAQALDPYGDVARIAIRAGVTDRQIMNAQSGRPVATIAYLRICAAIKYDPSPDLHGDNPWHFPEPQTFQSAALAVAFRIRRGLNGHIEDDAAKLMHLSRSTVSRIENGHEMQIGVVLKACNYLNMHPFRFFPKDCFGPTLAPICFTGNNERRFIA
jgi:hypothetical protein